MTAKSLKHKFASAVVDGTDATLVRPSNWNDDHDLWEGYRNVSGPGPDTITNADHLSLLVYSNAAAVTVNLAAPAAPNMPVGWRTRVKSTGMGGVTVTGTGGATINGATSLAIKTGDTLDIHSTGANDYVGIAHPAGAAPLPTQTIFTSGSGTYTTPANCRRIEITMVGGGAGGAGGNNGGVGTAGGNTTFGTFTANGAGAGPTAYQSGVPGSASGGQQNLTGGYGCDGGTAASGGNSNGGVGGSTIFGGAGGGGNLRAGNAAAANTGAGGGGGGGGTGFIGGAGGSSGGAVIAFINTPAATYSYAVGANGTGGAAGTSAYAGGNGAAGIIIIREIY